MNIPSDIHTHLLPSVPGQAVVNSPSLRFHPQPGQWYSVGVHPWESGSAVCAEELEQAVRHPQVLAIGETGADKLAGVSMDRQLEVFRLHARLGMATGKPLLIHAVKAAAGLLELKKTMRPHNTWIIHGFRGKAQLAEMYLAHGFCLSFGERFQPEALRLTPSDRLFLETDESVVSIDRIYARAAAVRQTSADSLKHTVACNVGRLMSEAGLYPSF